MLKWTNNAAGTLAAAITAADTAIALTGGHGNRFPVTSAEDWFIGTLRDAANNLEIIYVRARAGDALNPVVRGQDGTIPLAFPAGSAFELRWTNSDVLGAQDEAVSAVALSGTNIYAGAIRLLPRSYNVGQVYPVLIPAGNENTLPGATVNLSALGAIPVQRRGGIPLAVGDMHGLCFLYFNGAVLFLMNPRGGTEPVGTIIMTAAAVAPPGWLLLGAGQTASRTVDLALFGALGTAYGGGDGVNTFGLPETAGRFPVGQGAGAGLAGRPLGGLGGEEAHVLNTAEMPLHGHAANDIGHTHGVADPTHTHAFVTTPPSYGLNQIAATGAAQFNAGDREIVQITGTTQPSATGIAIATALSGFSMAAEGGNGPHNNMPPFFTPNFLIKR